jgi:hypothetical protein
MEMAPLSSRKPANSARAIRPISRVRP